jgi:hypothetical protein
MRAWHLLFALAGLAAGTAACGGNVVVDDSGSGGSISTSTGTTTTTTATTGTGTIVGSTSTSSTSASSTSTSSAVSSTSGGPTCVGQLTMQVDEGPTLTLGAACADANPQMATTPVGYDLVGGVAGTTLKISACAQATSDSQGVELTVPGAVAAADYSSGTASYVDAQGVTWTGTDEKFDVSLVGLGPVGFVITGSFNALVSGGLSGSTHFIQGSFDVCRTAGELVN